MLGGGEGKGVVEQANSPLSTGHNNQQRPDLAPKILLTTEHSLHCYQGKREREEKQTKKKAKNRRQKGEKKKAKRRQKEEKKKTKR